MAFGTAASTARLDLKLDGTCLTSMSLALSSEMKITYYNNPPSTSLNYVVSVQFKATEVSTCPMERDRNCLEQTVVNFFPKCPNGDS